MAARTVQINSFCGGSSKLVDSEFLGLEESVNMYPETVQSTDNFTTKMLKSVEGFERNGFFGEFSFIVGVLNVNTNPFNNASIKETLLIVTQDTLMTTSHDVSVYYPLTGEDLPVGTMTVSNPEHRVKMLELSNGIVIILVGSVLFACDPSTQSLSALSNITKPDAFDHAGKIMPTQMVQLNFRVVMNDKDSDYIYWSELNRPSGALDVHAFEQSLTQYAYTKTDGTVVTYDDNVFYAPAYGTYDPDTLTSRTVYTSSLNSMKMDFKSDNVVALRATDSSLFVFGSNSLQVLRWQNSTTAPFAIVAKTSDSGLDFGDAAAVIGQECYYVGKGHGRQLGVWCAGEGGAIRKVSTRAIDQRLASYAKITDVRTFAYSYKGHTFFIASIFGNYASEESHEETIAYDLSEDVWSDRESYDQEGNAHAWSAYDSVSIEGIPFFAVNTKGDSRYVTKFSPDSFTDLYMEDSRYPTNSYFIKKTRTTGIKYDGVNDIIVTALELVMNNGSAKVAADDSPAKNPKVMLQVSADGGRTWSNELWAYAGQVGQYSWRTRWNNLGRGARFAFRVRMSDPCNFEIATAYISYIPCGNRV